MNFVVFNSRIQGYSKSVVHKSICMNGLMGMYCTVHTYVCVGPYVYWTQKSKNSNYVKNTEVSKKISNNNCIK